MNYSDLVEGMKRFGSTEKDICLHGLGVPPEQVQKNVIIAPWWEPLIFTQFSNSELLSVSEFSAIKVWNIKADDLCITYIKTGIGAPVLMDALLSLGVTECKRIVFIGSVGALDTQIGIGDIVIPEYSICGDGASRYISSDILDEDVFGKKQYPDIQLFYNIKKITECICRESNVNWFIGKTFSIDTIFAQFAHIDSILNMGCNVIEMETASAFKAANIMNIPIVALFSVSDNTITNKSLVSGRTQEELDYRRYVRSELFPKIILKIFKDNNNV